MKVVYVTISFLLGNDKQRVFAYNQSGEETSRIHIMCSPCKIHLPRPCYYKQFRVFSNIPYKGNYRFQLNLLFRWFSLCCCQRCVSSLFYTLVFKMPYNLLNLSSQWISLHPVLLAVLPIKNCRIVYCQLYWEWDNVLEAGKTNQGTGSSVKIYLSISARPCNIQSSLWNSFLVFCHQVAYVASVSVGFQTKDRPNYVTSDVRFWLETETFQGLCSIKERVFFSFISQH